MAKVITFQSKEVLDIVRRNGVYIPDVSKCREHRSYEEDGGPKVWVFQFEDMTYEGFTTGAYFERCRCEMSLNEKDGLCKFVMIELHVDASRLSIGKTHNACTNAKVMDKLYLSDVAAVYHLENTEHWYFKKVVLDEKFYCDILFPSGLNTFTYQIWKKYRKMNNINMPNFELLRLRTKYNTDDFDDLMYKVWRKEMPDYIVESED